MSVIYFTNIFKHHMIYTHSSHSDSSVCLPYYPILSITRPSLCQVQFG